MRGKRGWQPESLSGALGLRTGHCMRAEPASGKQSWGHFLPNQSRRKDCMTSVRLGQPCLRYRQASGCIFHFCLSLSPRLILSALWRPPGGLRAWDAGGDKIFSFRPDLSLQSLSLVSVSPHLHLRQNHQESEHGGPRPSRDVFEVHAEPLLLWGLAAFRRQACITGRCFPKRIGGQLGHQPPVQRTRGGKVLLCKRGPTRHRGPQCSPRRNTGVKLGPPPIGFS